MKIWPKVEHRQCARHIYSNWRKKHKGRVLQKQFWKCVKATSSGEFETHLASLKSMSEESLVDFEKRNTETFCKSKFQTHSCCDVVDNNMAETFNSFILLARYKPIATMLEDIRLALMERMKNKKKVVSAFVAGIAPRISLKIVESYNEQQKCECRWNGEDSQTGFEVIHNGVGHAVDLEKRTCSCRSWELTGIPCAHAMSDILYMRHKPEDYIAKWYTSDTFEKTYQNLLQPVPGNLFWDHEGEGLVLPPDIIKKGPGKRKTARIKEAHEQTKGNAKYSRKGLPTKCSNCRETGHYKGKCPMPPKQQTVTTQSLELIFFYCSTLLIILIDYFLGSLPRKYKNWW